MPVTLRQWEDSLRQPALCELLPVRDYLDGCIIREFPARVRERVILELESGLSALGGPVFALRVLCEDGVHVVSDAVTALVADAADPIQSSDQCVASFGWQCVRRSHRLFKHSHQPRSLAKPEACSQEKTINSARPAGSPTAFL